VEQTINQRVKKARTSLNLSQEEVAEAIRKKVSAISKIESGSQTVTHDLISFYYRKGISCEWLLEKEGYMRREDNLIGAANQTGSGGHVLQANNVGQNHQQVGIGIDECVQKLDAKEREVQLLEKIIADKNMIIEILRSHQQNI